MALILHLTDIHLGKNQYTDDVKSEGLLQNRERESRLQIFKDKLKELKDYLVEKNKKLDIIVISGDITIRNQEEGFKLLNQLLNTLGNKKPLNENILITPGNHDIKWDSKDSKEKYELFLKYVRDEGYTTPFLDGIDNVNSITSKRKAFFLLPNENIQLILINSSNYCGLKTKFQIKTGSHLKTLAQKEFDALATKIEENKYGKEFLKFSNKLRLQDIARVSKNQLKFLTNKIKRETKHSFPQLRIGIMHHHLDAVSTSEEFKNFESITNAGLLSQFLKNQDVDMLLHGHKHSKLAYWKSIPNYNMFNKIGDQHNIYIISGGTLSDSNINKDDDIFRLIEIKRNAKCYDINIDSFKASNSKPNEEREIFSISISKENTSVRPLESGLINIVGSDINETYKNILNKFEHIKDENSTYKVVCEILNPFNNRNNIYTLPNDYRNDLSNSDPEKWLKEAVEWWSKPTLKLKKGIRFTHGQRLYHYVGKDGEHINQIKRACEIINKHYKEAASTGRIIINLFDPRIDDLTDEKINAPQFNLLQILIKNGNDPKSVVFESIAYFKKQEMRYWWVVNVTEIKKIITEIISSLKETNPDFDFYGGTITTISAIAYTSKAKAYAHIGVPLIDRIYDEYKSKFNSFKSNNPKNEISLWLLLYSLCIKPPYKEKKKLRLLWLRIITDLVPSEVADKNTVPVANEGLEYVIKQIEMYLDAKSTRLVKSFYDNLVLIQEHNRKFVKPNEDSTIKYLYETWRNDCMKAVNKLKVIIETIFA